MISSGAFWPETRPLLGSFTRFSFSAVPEIAPVGHPPCHQSPASQAPFLKPSPSLVHFSRSSLYSQGNLFLVLAYHLLPSFRIFFSSCYYSIDFDLPLNPEYRSLVMENLIFLSKSSLEGKYLHSIFFCASKKEEKQSPCPTKHTKNFKENERCDFSDFII